MPTNQVSTLPAARLIWNDTNSSALIKKNSIIWYKSSGGDRPINRNKRRGKNVGHVKWRWTRYVAYEAKQKKWNKQRVKK